MTTSDVPESNKHFTCALDAVVAREVQMASKEGRPVDGTRHEVRDELFGFMLAGLDTSSTFILCTIELPTDYQDIQLKLRTALRTAYAQSAQKNTTPSVTQITSSTIPCLEAVTQEVGRCGLTVPVTIRLTKRDTEILGHMMPKGTDVWLPVSGPGFLSPLIDTIPDSQRSKASLDHKSKWGEWDAENIGQLLPERWLKTDEKTGETYCDYEAGPINAFGSGARACFGKKWALLEVKILLTLIFWHFELQPTPGELSTYVATDGLTHRPRDTYVRLREIV